jgi:hypothetical protein
MCLCTSTDSTFTTRTLPFYIFSQSLLFNFLFLVISYPTLHTLHTLHPTSDSLPFLRKNPLPTSPNTKSPSFTEIPLACVRFYFQMGSKLTSTPWFPPFKPFPFYYVVCLCNGLKVFRLTRTYYRSWSCFYESWGWRSWIMKQIIDNQIKHLKSLSMKRYVKIKILLRAPLWSVRLKADFFIFCFTQKSHFNPKILA